MDRAGSAARTRPASVVSAAAAASARTTDFEFIAMVPPVVRSETGRPSLSGPGMLRACRWFRPPDSVSVPGHGAIRQHPCATFRAAAAAARGAVDGRLGGVLFRPVRRDPPPGAGDAPVRGGVLPQPVRPRLHAALAVAGRARGPEEPAAGAPRRGRGPPPALQAVLVYRARPAADRPGGGAVLHGAAVRHHGGGAVPRRDGARPALDGDARRPGRRRG